MRILRLTGAQSSKLLADPRMGDKIPPSRSNFFHFHAVFGKNLAK